MAELNDCSDRNASGEFGPMRYVVRIAVPQAAQDAKLYPEQQRKPGETFDRDAEPRSDTSPAEVLREESLQAEHGHDFSADCRSCLLAREHLGSAEVLGGIQAEKQPQIPRCACPSRRERRDGSHGAQLGMTV
jgi:hypothetical protein